MQQNIQEKGYTEETADETTSKGCNNDKQCGNDNDTKLNYDHYQCLSHPLYTYTL